MNVGDNKICVFIKSEKDDYNKLRKWLGSKLPKFDENNLKRVKEVLRKSPENKSDIASAFLVDEKKFDLVLLATGVKSQTVELRKADEGFLKKAKIPELTLPELNDAHYKCYHDNKSTTISSDDKKHAITVLLACYGKNAQNLCTKIVKKDKTLCEDDQLIETIKPS